MSDDYENESDAELLGKIASGLRIIGAGATRSMAKPRGAALAAPPNVGGNRPGGPTAATSATQPPATQPPASKANGKLSYAEALERGLQQRRARGRLATAARAAK